MTKKICLLITLLVLLTLPALAEDQVVAVVKGQEITMNELDNATNLSQLIMQLYQLDQQFTGLLFSSDSGQALLNEYRKIQLDQYIIQILLTQEVEAKGITLSEDEKFAIFQNQIENVMRQNNFSQEQLLAALNQQGLATLEDYRNFFMEQNEQIMQISALRDQVVAATVVLEPEVAAYYENNQKYFKKETSVHARHILLKTKEEALEVLAKVQGGADFIEMAKEYSTGPSGPNGGDLGFFGKGKMVPEFDEAVFQLQAGEISDIVETDFGFHIIKVEEVQPESIVSFEEAKDQIKKGLLEQKKEEQWNNFVEELRANAEIEIKL